VSDFDWASATVNLCELGIDPIEIFRCLLLSNGQIAAFDIDHTYNFINTTGIGLIKLSFAAQIAHSGVEVMPPARSHPMIVPIRDGTFNSLEIEEGKPKYRNSLFGCLWRRAEIEGKILKIEIGPNLLGSQLPSLIAIIRTNPAL